MACFKTKSFWRGLFVVTRSNNAVRGGHLCMCRKYSRVVELCLKIQLRYNDLESEHNGSLNAEVDESNAEVLSTPKLSRNIFGATI